MRVVTLPAYTTRNPNIAEDTNHWNGYRVRWFYSERDESYPRTEFMLNALGLSQWRLALLLYHQPEKYGPCHPKLWMFGMEGVNYDPEMHPISDDSFPLVAYPSLVSRNRGMVNEARRRLETIQNGPQFAVLASFAFPVYGAPDDDPKSLQRVIYGGFVERLLIDFADLSRRSGDSDLANAAALAEMTV